MPWASGSFTRLNGATGWVDDKNAAIFIVASRHDNHDNDLATGINTCLTRDNQAKPTASFLPNADNSIDLGSAAFRWRAVYPVALLSGDGAVGAPGWSFASDADTGIYRIGANNLGVSVGGTKVVDISTASMAATIPIYLANGSQGTPSLSFSSDTDSGIYFGAANDWAFTVGNATALELFLNGAVPQSLFTNGTAAIPALSFQSDPDTGIYRSGTNGISLVAGGSRSLIADTVSVYLSRNGTAANPALTFESETSTGFYRDTANQIAIALGGVTAGQIAQGSFTGTLTGFTANPTGTVNYQRVGKLVHLWITGAITATSNASTMTMTGLPAIIQPASSNTAPCGEMRSDAGTGGGAVVGTASVNGGTITFNKGLTSGSALIASSGSWDSSGTKGLNAGWSLTYTIA